MLHSMRYSGEWDAPRGQNLFDTGAPFYGVYRTSDDKWLSVGAIEPQFFAQLIVGLQLQEQVALGTQNDSADWPRQRRLIGERIAERTRDEWAAVFDGTDACVAPVLAPEEAAADPQVVARQVFQVRDGLTHPAPAPRFSRTPAAAGGPAPRVGGTPTRSCVNSASTPD